MVAMTLQRGHNFCRGGGGGVQTPQLIVRTHIYSTIYSVLNVCTKCYNL